MKLSAKEEVPEMNDFYLGYVFTGAELQVIFSCIGITNVYGLPLHCRELDAEEEMSIIRQLLRKEVMSWDGSEYVLNPVFAGAFEDMKNSRGSLSLLSKNYLMNAYVCFGGEQIVIWEISGYVTDRFTLLIFSWEDFREMMLKEGFVPDLGTYCGKIPNDFEERVVRALESGEIYGDFSDLDFSVLIRTVTDSGTEYCAAGRETFGSYLAECSGSKCRCTAFDREKIMDLIQKSLTGGDQDEGNRDILGIIV